LEERREPLEAFLHRLPVKILTRFARIHKEEFNLKISQPKEKLISQILEKVPDEIIVQDLYAAYGWAGNVTVHLFHISKSELNNISEEAELLDILNNLNLISKKQITGLPEPVEIKFVDDKIRIRHEFLGKPIIYQDPVTRKMQTIKPLRTSFTILNPQNGVTEVRVYERVHALNTVKVLTRYFGGNYEKISFTREHLAQWIEWALTLRNARFKPLGPISTLYMSAQKEYDLRDIEMFREWWKKGEKIGGVYIKFEYRPKEEIGFGINAEVGKIMFRTFASEEEIEFVVDQGCKILGF